jgi:hypothetical protein
MNEFNRLVASSWSWALAAGPLRAIEVNLWPRYAAFNPLEYMTPLLDFQAAYLLIMWWWGGHLRAGSTRGFTTLNRISS